MTAIFASAFISFNSFADSKICKSAQDASILEIKDQITRLEKILKSKTKEESHGFAITQKDASLNFIHKKAQIKCENGHNSQRLHDISFFTQDIDSDQLHGPFKQGMIHEGVVLQSYIGTTMAGDLMQVDKLTNGKKVIGYNVTVSLCEYKTREGYPILGNERAFQIELGSMVLDNDNECGFGAIDAARMSIGLKTWQGKSREGYSIADFERHLDRTFFKVDCHQMY